MLKSKIAIGGNESFIQISNNLGYLKTYNYDLFSFYPTNRTPSHWRKILESIETEDLTDRQPILVYKCQETGLLYISDGQNRFLACKESKRPVYAIVVLNESLSNGESSLSILNSYQKNWSKEDYLDYYCAKNIPAYITIKKAKEETGFSISVLCGLWQTGKGELRANKYQRGEAEFPKEALIRARLVYRCYRAVMKHKLTITDLTSKSTLVKAIFSFLRAGAKSSEFIRQLSKYGNMIENCGNVAQYIRIFNHIYNHRKHDVNKKYFQPTMGVKSRVALK